MVQMVFCRITFLIALHFVKYRDDLRRDKKKKRGLRSLFRLVSLPYLLLHFPNEGSQSLLLILV